MTVPDGVTDSRTDEVSRRLAGHLEALQCSMVTRNLDALLLGNEAAGYFATGCTRIGVHRAGWGVPIAVVPRSGLPHVVTGDPDGAVHLPADHVHTTLWDPTRLTTELPRWLGIGPGTTVTVGVDTVGPGGLALIRQALPGADVVDAFSLVAEAMSAKSPDEIALLGDNARFVTAAAEAGLTGGRRALAEALGGCFPILAPSVSDRAVSLAIRRQGMIGEARIGPGDATVGWQALEQLQSGRLTGEMAGSLPAGATVVGIGWAYEPPLLRAGKASPPGVRLRPGAVLVVRWDACAVTVAVGGDGPVPLGPTPEEVAR